MRSSVRAVVGIVAAGWLAAACGNREDPALAEAAAQAERPAEDAAAGSAEATAQAAARSAGPAGDAPDLEGQDGDDAQPAVDAADARAAAAALGVPLFPAASVKSAILSTGETGRGAIVTLETKAMPAEVISYYRDELKRSGHAIKAEVNAGGIRMLGAEQANRSLTVQVTPREGGGSTVALMGGAR